MLDVDQHLFEPRTAWLDYIDPAFRDDALRIEDDVHGWPWLCWREIQLSPVEVQHPGCPTELGQARLAMTRGEPAPARYEDLLPPEYGSGPARLQFLDQSGVDRCVLFPNFGLLWERALNNDVPTLCANMTAFNRWMASEVADSNGRLFGVGHISLLDPGWAVREIKELADNGLRLAMMAPSPVNGKPLSDVSLDPVWAAFCDWGVSPVFHVGNFEGPLDPAWHEGDPDAGDQLLNSVMLWVAPAVALSNMILHGTLERFPGLRIGVVELTAGWVPSFLVQIDGASDFYAARHGGPMRALELRPSDYFRRQVKVAALPYERPDRLIRLAGQEIFMFGSDWPHAEGVADPGAEANTLLKVGNGDLGEGFLGGNASWLLRLDA